MTAALVPSPPQERAEYGVGASSSAAAIGVSDYRSELDAWLEATGRAAPFEGNERTRWGQTLEPVIRAHYVERNGATVFVPPVSLYHREHAFIRATPDGIVLDPTDERWMYVGPQVKNVGLRMAPLWADGAIPNDYLVQGVVEMAVADLPRIDFAVLIGGQEYREATLWRDAELEAEVIERLVLFWRLVETDTQPAIDDSKAFRSHVLRQIKRRVTIEASTDALALLERWREVARQAKQLKIEEGAIKNKVLAVLAAANASKLTSPLGNVSVGANQKKTVAWKGVAEAMRPALFTVRKTELELEALRAELADDRLDHPLLQRIDAMRAQLRLVGATQSFDDIVARHTTLGDPSVTRPQGWTKDIRGDEEHQED